MKEFIKEFIGTFLRDNAEDIADIPKSLLGTAMSTGVASMVPNNHMTPQLNNLKIKFAAEALKHTADTKARADKIKAAFEKKLKTAIWAAFGEAALGALL